MKLLSKLQFIGEELRKKETYLRSIVIFLIRGKDL